MTDGEALLRAMAKDRAEYVPRLAYADWLTDNGAPEQAECAREWVELRRLRPTLPLVIAAGWRTTVTDATNDMDPFGIGKTGVVTGYAENLPPPVEPACRYEVRLGELAATGYVVAVAKFGFSYPEEMRGEMRLAYRHATFQLDVTRVEPQGDEARILELTGRLPAWQKQFPQGPFVPFPHVPCSLNLGTFSDPIFVPLAGIVDFRPVAAAMTEAVQMLSPSIEAASRGLAQLAVTIGGAWSRVAATKKQSRNKKRRKKKRRR